MVRLLSLPHSTTEVCPTTPDMPVFEDRPVSEIDKIWPLHSMPCTQLQPYTPVRTGMLSLVASTGLGPVVVGWGVVLSEPLARGVSDEGVYHHIAPYYTLVHTTHSRGYCVPGFLQPFSHQFHPSIVVL